MRNGVIGFVLALTVVPVLDAQDRDSTRTDTLGRGGVLSKRALPREIASRVTEVFNAAGTLRVTGSLDIAQDQTVEGDVAVLDGPVTIAGRVTGTVVAINADVTLRPTARIEGDLLVVGGEVRGRESAQIVGDMVVYRQPLGYREDRGLIIADRIPDRPPDEDDDHWWRRVRRRPNSASGLRLTSGGTYNRVEGLPIHFGPVLRRDRGDTRIELEALGILRTANEVKWDSENLGHAVRTEVRFGRPFGIALGGRLFDVVDAVEAWQLTDTEVGLASVFLHRDYRDYFDRHGGTGYMSLVASDETRLTFSFSDQRWGTRTLRDPWTLFRDSNPWRANPVMDDGQFHVGNATLTIDTRNDVDNPLAGWYLVADYERGRGTVTSFGPTSPGVRDDPDPTGGRVAYQRGFMDLRRYNRLSPHAQLNMRVVAGGWLSGDPLPLQRRFSVGGPGSLPGFDFRDLDGRTDVGQCSTGIAPSGRPAECERMLLAQAEYRGALNVALLRDYGDDRPWWRDFDIQAGPTWVLFADAGRGWLVGDRLGDLRYPSGDVPRLGTFRSDIGAGLDVGVLGLYVAKSVSDKREPANFFVRVRKRF